ncbi:MAG: DUF2752 domain-containing protein [Planctomycetota bacterium]
MPASTSQTAPEGPLEGAPPRDGGDGPQEPVLWAGRSREHWLILLLAAIAALGLVVMGVVLRPDARGVGTHEQLGMKPCMTMELWDLPCPGCGVTTSVTMATQGRFLDSLHNQPFGFVVWLCGLGFIGWAIVGHVRGRDLWARFQMWRSGPWLWTLGSIAMCAWVYKFWLVRS